MTEAYPDAPVQSYAGAELYYFGNIGDGTYLCDAGIDGNAGFMNSACVDPTGTTFVASTHTESSNAIATCGDLPKAFCARLTELVDSTDSNKVLMECQYTTGDKCSKVEVGVNPKRPTEKSARSDPSVTVWYAGSETYGYGYDYPCAKATDQLDDTGDYHNIHCEQEGAYADGDSVYCVGPVADGSFRDVKNLSDPMSHKVPCYITTCNDMPGELCTNTIDLYTLTSGTMGYTDTCDSDGNGGCKPKGSTVVPFHTPDPSAALSGWWHMGSDLFDSTTAYDCADQDVGTATNPYINVMCDQAVSGAVDTTSSYRCNDPASLEDQHAIDCSAAADCDIPTAWCTYGIDIYTDDGSQAVYGFTCVRDSGTGNCKLGTNKRLHKPEDDSNRVGDWWFVGSAEFDKTTTFACDQYQDIGTSASPYINVLCDTEFGGSVVTDNPVICNDPVNSGHFGDAVAADCSPVDCASIPKAMCQQPIDLYLDDGTQATYADTCVSTDDSDYCVGTATTTDNPETDSDSTEVPAGSKSVIAVTMAAAVAISSLF